jgi:hypothetical protein
MGRVSGRANQRRMDSVGEAEPRAAIPVGECLGDLLLADIWHRVRRAPGRNCATSRFHIWNGLATELAR